MPHERILIVEDEAIVQVHLRRIVEDAGFEVVGVASSGEQALAQATAVRPDVVLMDLRLAGPLDGIATALRLRAMHDAALIFVTAHADDATLARAAEALPMGYVVKPFERDDIRAAIATALAQRAALRGTRGTRRALPPRRDERAPAAEVTPFHGMVGQGAAFGKLVRQIGAVATGDWTVWIEGETGTGKELVARAIHQLSPRGKGAFVPLNCGALSESLATAQLFGHTQGAFTGAVRDQRGLFEEAHGGTLFLDEVAELSLSVQASLLRVLEDRTVLPLGTSRSRQLDFRLLVASHRDVAAMARDGRFRQDLLYRLRVARVVVPPLRQRGDDLELLTHFFLRTMRRADTPEGAGISPEALDRLRSYAWPGNVRELRSALEHAAIRAGAREITEDDLPPEIAERSTESDDATGDLHEALKSAHGNHTAAARRLGISRATFYRRLAKLSAPR